jgi:hypothetical protein
VPYIVIPTGRMLTNYEHTNFSFVSGVISMNHVFHWFSQCRETRQGNLVTSCVFLSVLTLVMLIQLCCVLYRAGQCMWEMFSVQQSMFICSMNARHICIMKSHVAFYTTPQPQPPPPQKKPHITSIMWNTVLRIVKKFQTTCSVPDKKQTWELVFFSPMKLDLH